MAQPSRYLSVQELYTAPQGLSLKNIPAPGSTGPSGVTGQQEYAELSDLIQRASGMMDDFCQLVLGATQDTEALDADGWRAGVDANGYLWVVTEQFPVLSLSLFEWGYPAIGGVTFTQATVSDVLISGPRKNRLVYPGTFLRQGMPPARIQYTYVNGYPNAFLTASTLAGATSLPVDDLTGFVASQRVTIYDAGATEGVVVSASFTPATGPGNLSLAAGTTFAHTFTARPAPAGSQPADVRVSALPPDLKQACLLVCKFLTERRGISALVMARTGGVQGATGAPAGHGMEEIPVEAQATLHHYSRII